MREAWHRFGAAYRMELRLLCLHWSYPLLHLLWALLLWYTNRDNTLGSARMALEGSMGRMSIALLSLAALFVAGAAASRSASSRFAPLDDALPTGFEIPLGRWLAALTGLAGALLEPLAYAFKLGSTASWLEAAPIYVGEALISVAVASAFAWWLVDRIGMRRWLYLALAAGWLAFLIGPEIIDSPARALPETRLFDFMRRDGTLFRELWGRLLEGERPFWFNLTYAGVASLFLALVGWRVEQHRLRRRPVAATLALVLCGAMAATGAAGWLQQMQQWGRTADRQQSQRSELGRELSLLPPPPEAIDRYTVTADLTRPAAPRFTAKLTLRNRGSEPLASLDLTLHEGLKLVDSSLPATRTGPFITMKLPAPLAPGDRTDVTLTYGGNLFEVARRWDRLPVPIFFTAQEGVRLSENALWYPLAGRQMLALDQSNKHETRFAFDLQVQAPTGWGVATNLAPAAPGHFAADAASWVLLMASPRLVVEQHGTVTLAASPADIDAARQHLPAMQNGLAYLQRFFPDVAVTGMSVTVFDGESGLPDGTPPAGNHVSMLLQRYSLTDAAQHGDNAYWHIGEPIVRDLWLMTGAPANPMWIQDIGRFLWQHYQADGNQAAIAQSVAGQNPMIRFLADAHRQYGDEGLLRVLKGFRTNPPTFDPNDLDALERWVKEAARRDS